MIITELADIPFKVDRVDVFRKPKNVLPIAQEAIRIGAQHPIAATQLP